VAYTSIPPNPLASFAAITKSDATTYDPPLIALRIGDISGGDTLVVKNLAGTSVTFLNVGEGEFIWGPFTAVMSTSTTVASIIGYKNE
jgi:hypothetical protein